MFLSEIAGPLPPLQTSPSERRWLDDGPRPFWRLCVQGSVMGGGGCCQGSARLKHGVSKIQKRQAGPLSCLHYCIASRVFCPEADDEGLY